ncbi:MAG: phage minor capsid protein [Oscillospiraceae bacterium]|nr:phage minor capsid protein [Oscillospiraceae bacterium]
MLTPNYLEQLPQPMIALVNELQEEIIAEVTKRIVKANVLTPSSEWLLYKANQLRLSSAAVNRIIAKNAKVRERVIRELYTEAVKLALNEDAKIYRYAISEGALDPMSGAKLTSYFKSVALNDTFKKGLAATNGLMRNLTNSMAAVSNRMLSDALDLAWLEVASGAFTPDEAVYKAIEKLAEKGLAVVEYKSGHRDQVDVAVRRAVRTGINKTCCDMQLDLANEMGSDLVEVSSHFGARPTHAEWQGQIYSLSGKHPKYKSFSVTGYGRGDGLGGWNCRHNFYPFFEGISIPASEPTFTEAENLEYYKKTQKQRGYERAVRRSKRELAALDSARTNTSDAALKAKLDKEFARKSSVLKKREKRLNDFCRDNGLLKDNARTRVNGFGRSISQKAVWAEKTLDKQAYLEYNMLRKVKNTGKFECIKEPMQMKYVKKVASLAGIELNGIEIDIIRDYSIIGTGFCGYTHKNGRKIQLYPDAFSSRENLVKTLGHERIHCEQIKLFGQAKNNEELNDYERAARFSEEYWWQNFMNRVNKYEK